MSKHPAPWRWDWVRDESRQLHCRILDATDQLVPVRFTEYESALKEALAKQITAAVNAAHESKEKARKKKLRKKGGPR